MPPFQDSAKKSADIQPLLIADEEYPSPPQIKAIARLSDYAGEYRRSIDDPDAFWGDYAKQFQWSRKWTQVSDFDGVHHRWFLGGQTNITVNALDRHALSDHCNRVAFIWLGEDGSERLVTYAQLYRMVCRFA